MDRPVGRIVKIVGAVVDVKFKEGELPEVHNALILTREDESEDVFEVMQHVGNNTVRCVAMQSDIGLVRDMKVYDTREPIKVPVGTAVLGRMFNILGKPIDKMGPVECKERHSIHRSPPGFAEQKPITEVLETGIKVILPVLVTPANN